jgi:transposase
LCHSWIGEEAPRFVGIDVGSKQLHAAASDPAPALPRRVANTTEGIAALVAAGCDLTPTLVVLEATGNYHRPLLAALLAASLPVAVVNPAQVAAFRQSRLGRQKTDRADAQLLARFAALHHDELRQATPDEPDLARLRALVGYRDDLVARRTRLRHQHHAAEWRGEERVLPWLAEDLAEVERRLVEVEQAIQALLADRPETAVLTRQRGVNFRVAAAVLASLPPGVLGNPQAAAASAGLHPRQEQSGQAATSHLSKQGCPALRRYLDQAAMAAIRWDPELRAWYERLCARGKAGKSAVCAVAHKLLRPMMGRIRALRQEDQGMLPLAA